MRRLLCVLAVVLVICYNIGICSAADPVDFNYDNQSAWAYFNASQCGNNRQSPIDIIVRDTVPASSELRRLQLQGWDVSVDGKVSNVRGLSVMFEPNRRTARTFIHTGEYEMFQFHFHWGNSSGTGSEHTVNGFQYDGEVHFVHSKIDPPANSTDGDFLTVIGVFLESSETAPVAGTFWENFVDTLSYNQNRAVSGITYSDLLPTNRSYYHYNGSLTTPLCNEIIQWVVLENPIQVPAMVLRRLRMLPADVSATTFRTVNYREVQPLNSRQVLRFSSATTNTPFRLAIIVSVIMLLFINSC